MSWNEKRTERLKSLWAEKLSITEIAERLGYGITRNAVAGKLHRLGLTDDDRTGASAAARAEKRRHAHKVKTAQRREA